MRPESSCDLPLGLVSIFIFLFLGHQKKLLCIITCAHIYGCVWFCSTYLRVSDSKMVGKPSGLPRLMGICWWLAGDHTKNHHWRVMISVDPEVTQTTVDNQTVSGGGEINHYTFFYCGTLVFLLAFHYMHQNFDEVVSRRSKEESSYPKWASNS